MTATAEHPTVTRPALRLTALATLAGIVLNCGLELAEFFLVPDHYESFDSGLLPNMATVVVWSLGGFAIAYGLLRLGTATSRRTPVAWVTVVLSLLTVLPFFFVAIPGTLAAAAYTLAEGRPGSAAIVRVLAVIAFLAFVAVSIGMFPFAEV